MGHHHPAKLFFPVEENKKRSLFFFSKKADEVGKKGIRNRHRLCRGNRSGGGSLRGESGQAGREGIGPEGGRRASARRSREGSSGRRFRGARLQKRLSAAARPGSAAPSAAQTRRAGRSARNTRRPRGPGSCWAAAERSARAAAPRSGGDRPSFRGPFPSPEAPRTIGKGGETAAGAPAAARRALAVESPSRLGRGREATGEPARRTRDAEASCPAGSSRLDAPLVAPPRPRAAGSPGTRRGRHDGLGGALPRSPPGSHGLRGSAGLRPPGRPAPDALLKTSSPPGESPRPGRCGPRSRRSGLPRRPSVSSRRRARLAGGAPDYPLRGRGWTASPAEDLPLRFGLQPPL